MLMKMFHKLSQDGPGFPHKQPKILVMTSSLTLTIFMMMKVESC